MVTKSNKLFYIGRIGYPNNAPGLRVYNNACILNDIGYDVSVICLKREEDTQLGAQLNPQIRYNFISNLETVSKGRMQSFKNLCNLVFGVKTYRQLRTLIDTEKPSVIILYNDLLPLSVYLKKLCRKRGIKLVADVTEWYDNDNLKQKAADYIVPFLTDKRIRYVDKMVGNIIAISPYLREFYLSKKCNVLFEPPVFEIQKGLKIAKYNYSDKPVINFLYAGSAGNKDIIAPFVEALKSVNIGGVRIRLDILGLDDDFFKLMDMNVSDFETYGIYNHGRVSHDEVKSFLYRADFSLLLRHNRRYAKAGFSTKLAESMAHGVAVFANRVGGAETILDNGIDGFAIDSTDKESIISNLDKLLSMSDDQIVEMRKNAYSKALELFDLDKYKQKFKQFLDE